jgi:uncharacterized NAD-dependent epimerase/dehydratase family protein
MMKPYRDGDAIIYCQGAYGTTNGKTAHGLVRRTSKYRLLSVVDAAHAGKDAGTVLDGIRREIPVFADIDKAVRAGAAEGTPPTHLVIGLAPDGGRMTPEVRKDIVLAIQYGLSVDSGLHDFLTDDAELKYLAFQNDVSLRDVRKPPPKDLLHFFSGRIEEVQSIVIAVLGTDSAVGKRTTAWLLVDALNRAELTAELVGTGQTAWLQGARFGVVMDSLPNDFVAGEIEHAVVSAYEDCLPDVIVVEGQGSLMHPAYPGGFEILAAARPHAVVLQHAPARREYDGFPGHPIHPLTRQIRAIETVSDTPVVAVAVNHESIEPADIPGVCDAVAAEAERPAFDVLANGADGLVSVLLERFPRLRKTPDGRQLASA